MTGSTLEIFVLGTSQAVAPTEVRERMHVDLDEVHVFLDELLGDRHLLAEAVPLATCGRLELYCVSSDPDRALRLLARLMARRAGLSADRIRDHSYALRGPTAVRHLFRVAAGLDSVVHGEAEILGQVREAAHHPSAQNGKGPILHRLFEHALQTGKKVRTETEVGRGAASLASAAVGVVREQMKEFEKATAVVLGAGDTGGLVARLLKKSGVGRLVILNRTFAAAESLARELGAEARPWNEVPAMVAEGDLVVGAVTIGEWIVTPDMVPGRGDKARWFLDLAHPRNVDPAVGERPDTSLVDLDAVFRRVESAREARAAQVPLAEAIVKEQAEHFLRWFRARPGIDVLRAVRREVLRRASAEAERFARGREPTDREDFRRFARTLARRLLHTPTVALREADPANEEGRVLLESAQALFGVEEESR